MHYSRIAVALEDNTIRVFAMQRYQQLLVPVCVTAVRSALSGLSNFAEHADARAVAGLVC
jgi:hypothetical protein